MGGGFHTWNVAIADILMMGMTGLKEDSIRYVSVLGGLPSKGTGRSWLAYQWPFFFAAGWCSVKCVCSRGRVVIPADRSG